MLRDIRNLEKIDDILNSEGTILGLFKHRRKEMLYLGSYLKDGSGTVFYAVDVQVLKKYFNDDLALKEIYLLSADAVVPRQRRTKTEYFVLKDLSDLITCGERVFSENPEYIKVDRLARLFERIK